MEGIMDIVVQYLMEIVGSAVTIAIGIFGTWLLKKFSTNKNLQNISEATTQVIKSAQDTVLMLQQTLVDGWKASQGGKLTSEQVATLQAKTLEITMAKLADPTIKLLEAAKSDVTTMIQSAAESFILEMKKGVEAEKAGG